jgi:hypothetical protein
MRLVLALSLLAANPTQCGDQSPTPEDAGAAGAGGEASKPPPLCDERGDCATCMSCAASGPCAATVQACDQSPSCLGYADCVSGCAGHLVCASDCSVLYPDGAAEHDAAMRCIICNLCPADCGTPSGCH